MGELLKQYLWILDLMAILLCSFFAAKLSSVYIGQKIAVPPSTAKPAVVARVQLEQKKLEPAEAYRIILDRNIFDSEMVAETPEEETMTEGTPSGEPVKTGLGIKVMGVLVMGMGEDNRSSAIIESSGKTDVYNVGAKDGFSPNTKLMKVQPDRIIFSNGGRLEYALFEEDIGPDIFGPPPTESTSATSSGPVEATTVIQGEKIRQEGEGKFTIDKKEVDNALGNLERLYTEIRAVPNFAGGKVSGMKILSVKQGSLFDKLGLQRGDVLEKINGMELDVKKGLEIFNQLKAQRNLTVDLIRQGVKKTLEYEIR